MPPATESPRRGWWLVLLAVLSCLLAGCGGTDVLDDFYLFVPPPAEDGIIRHSNLIVTGQITDIQRIGMPIRNWSSETAGYEWLHPLRVRIRVDEMVDGLPSGLGTRELDVRTVHGSSHWWASIPAVSDLSSRRLHYLRTNYPSTESIGRPFYVADLLSSSTTLDASSDGIRSGAERISLARKALVQRLLPQSCSATRKPDLIRRNASLALNLGGYMETLPALKFLLACPDRDLQREICLGMIENGYTGQEVCLDSLHVEIARLSRADREIVEHKRRSDEEFRKWFLEDPVAASTYRQILRGRDGLVDVVRLIAMHPSKDLAAKARETLAKLGPAHMALR